MNANDGGPAFPTLISSERWENRDNETHYSHESEGGMSLRDWFAGQAMNAALAGFLADPNGTVDPKNKDIIAASSYAMADAMLVARGTPKVGP